LWPDIYNKEVNKDIFMAAAVKKQSTSKLHIGKSKVKRPGVHSKTKNSKNKSSKNYSKQYVSQGR
jgi:hypothetical protein